MVKRQTTTRTIGNDIAKLIQASQVGVMVRHCGELVACLSINGKTAVLDGGEIVQTSDLRIYRATIQQIRELVENPITTPERIVAELSDCKSANRYVVDVRGDRFWVFGMPNGELLVRRIVDGIMKPLRTMQYDEIERIEAA